LEEEHKKESYEESYGHSSSNNDENVEIKSSVEIIKETDGSKEETKDSQEIKEPQDIKEDVKEFKDKTEEKAEEIKEEIEISINKEKEEIKESEKDISVLEKEKEQVEEIEKSTKTDGDDEISIDFSALKNKAKNLFKRSGKKKTKDLDNKKEKSDEITLDLDKVTSFTKKNSTWIIPLVLIIIAIFASTYFRVMPFYLPVTDDWAGNQVQSFYKNQISDQINQQYPNLPAANKDNLIEKEYQKFIIENKETIKQQTKATSEQYKTQFQDDDGQTYLLAIDPYYWYSEARNIVEYGRLGDSNNEEGERVFSLRNGRNDKFVTAFTFHPYLIAWLFKILNFFSGNISLLAVAFLAPVILIGLSIIPAFFITRRVAGNVGGFFAAIIVAINAALLGRTPAGFSDTDAYNIIFPLMIAWMFLESFRVKGFWKRTSLLTGAGLFTSFYAISWGGWSYIANFVIYTSIIYLVYQIIVNWKDLSGKVSKIISFPTIKNTFMTIIIYFVTTGIFITLFKSFRDFSRLLYRPFQFIFLKEVAIKSLWPNVLTTVAEFNEIAFSNIVSQMGGNILFLIAVIGIILTFVKKDESGKHDIKYAVFLAIWMAGTAYSFTKGMRFSILMVPAFAISFGAGIGICYHYFGKWISKGINLNKRITNIILVIIFCLLLIAPLNSAEDTGKSEVPSMNDDWYAALTKIKDSTTDAVITSWWDFGHWFYTISERRVTFDGGDQGERIHWVGKTLLTSDEKVSVGLLRMLNCGQEKPVHLLEEFFSGDTVKAVKVLNGMMVLNDKKKAIKLLANEGLSSEQIAEIIKITYCDDLLDQFYITSEDMVSKGGVWGHFGGWDFKKAAMYQTVSKNKENGQQILQEKFGLNEEEADDHYYQIINNKADNWISTWPGYQGKSGCEQKEANLLSCNLDMGNGIAKLEIDLKTMEAKIPSDQGSYYPNSIVYATKEGVVEKEFKENLLGVSIILLPGNSNIITSHPLQAKSMFTQLFFFDGHGLNCFEKFDDRTQITGGRIITWKVDWDCKEKNQVYFLPQEEVNAVHILISTQNRDVEEALKIIEEIKEKANANNFAELAMTYSEDAGSKDNGGQLGWFGKGAMVPEFEEAAFSLNKGQISDPVKTQFGYHLILVLDKRTT
jgi:dolichyl-phosphooligosaccharide-protein glycotransferase